MSSEEIGGAVEFGQLFDGLDTVSLQSARVLARTHQLAGQLHARLETQAVIDQAIGVLMARSGGTEAEALDGLCALSQSEHQELAVAARGIVDGAAWGARVRHRGD